MMSARPFVFASILYAATTLLPATLPTLRAQTVIPSSKATAHAPAMTASEERTSKAFDAARKLGSPELYAFLRSMPKGGDLHMHLSGAIYAETFIAEAAKQGLCIASPPPVCTVNAETGAKATQTPSSAAAPTTRGNCPVPVLDPKLPPLPLSLAPTITGGRCAAGQLPASDALKSQPLYDALVDSFSMRGYVPTPGITGHDQFFATFGRFGELKGVAGEWLDKIATRAAAQNEQYLEVMNTPSFGHAVSLGYRLGWPAGAETDVSHEQLAKLRDQLLAAGLRDEVATDRGEFADAVRQQRKIGDCDGPVVGNLPAKCNVQVRWIYQVLRAFPPEQVFAQTLLGFEVAQAELDSGHPMVLGINFVQPEDAHLAMRDYHLQMQMMDYLHSVYPKVHISLHAGELAFGMTPPDGLGFHIREAIELGHAERIGHGMDVLYEEHANELLKEMAAKHIDVEVNLTSNDVILGQTRTDHPLAAYRAAHVPVSLSTDDEGVSRIDLTHEYVKAAEEQNLTYVDLKRAARTSLEHSFLPGASLWAQPDDFTRRVSACGAATSLDAEPSSACRAFLNGSERAAQQYELERRFAVFEAQTR